MRELMSYLPENYPDSRETVAIQRAIQPEVELAWRLRDELLAQLTLSTATWGLWYWEDALGLGACEALPLDTRRRQVAAKLQGRAATTPQVVRDVAQTMLGVPVTVIEHFGEYRVELGVHGGGTLPAGTMALKARLREIMPAHLDWALLIPLLRRCPVRVRLGFRRASSAPPRHRLELAGTAVPAGWGLGTRYSTVTLPQGRT